jgi:chemotaxis protein methyltransferase CheR
MQLFSTAVLPALARPRSRRPALWSAGCGAGHDAWTLAMLLEEANLPRDLEIHVLATEAEPGALACAHAAVYPDDHMHEVDAARRRRHFVRGEGPRSGLWRVIAPLRDRVELYQLDLTGAWPPIGPFDAVVCHDAIAALDAPNALRLLDRFSEVLAPGGVLLLGSEISADAVPRLEPITRAAFRKPA